MYFLTIRRAINAFIRTRPMLFGFVMSRRKKFRDIVVNNETEIIIEGYPRSANTFAVAAFVFAQNKSIKIARHTHAPAQIMLGVESNIPIVLLIRNPVDAVISLVIRDSTISLDAALKMYIWYHESIQDIKDKCVVVDFHDATENFSNIIDMVNVKYNKNYLNFTHDKCAENNIFKLVEEMERMDSGGELRESHVARPSEARKSSKQKIISQLQIPANSKLLNECNRLYEQMRVKEC